MLYDCDMVCPKADLNSFELVPYWQSDDVALLLICVAIFICDFLLDPLEDPYDVDHLALDPFVLVLPAEIFVFVLAFHGLVLDLVDFVLFVLEAYLGTAFDLFPVEQFDALDEVHSSLFQLFWLFECGASGEVDADEMSVGVDEAEVEEGHRPVLCLLAAKFDPDQSADEIARFSWHYVLEGQRLLLFSCLWLCGVLGRELVWSIAVGVLWLEIWLIAEVFQFDRSLFAPPWDQFIVDFRRGAPGFNLVIVDKLCDVFGFSQDVSLGVTIPGVIYFPDYHPQLADLAGIDLAEKVRNFYQIIPPKDQIGPAVFCWDYFGVVDGVGSDEEAIDKGLPVWDP